MATGSCLVFGGIAGNEINWTGAVFRSQMGNVWVNPLRISLGGLQWMILDPTGTDRPSSWTPRTYPGGLVRYYYPPLIKYLDSRDWTVFEVPLDWRKRINDNAPLAAQFIRDASRNGPVTLVAHSRGGLVAAAACKLLEASGELGLIRQGVSLGTPWKGSYEPYGYLGGWGSVPLWLNRIGLAASLNFTFLVKGKSVREVCATWPGLYELAPDPVAGRAAGDLLLENWYNAAQWARQDLPVSQFHMDNARARWATNPALPATLRWTHIVGTGFLTLGPVKRLGGEGTEAALGRSFDGDGTVPLWSANALGGNVIAVPVSHSELPGSQICHGIMEAAFQT